MQSVKVRSERLERLDKEEKEEAGTGCMVSLKLSHCCDANPKPSVCDPIWKQGCRRCK